MQMQGLSLKNVEVKIKDGKKVLFEEFGEMLFTHFGVSGPLILSASSVVNDKIRKKELAMEIDLKPALSEEKLDARILRDFEENKNRQFKNVLSGLLPAKMILVMIQLSGITPEKKINEITKEERRRLVNCTGGFNLQIAWSTGYLAGSSVEK